MTTHGTVLATDEQRDSIAAIMVGVMPPNLTAESYQSIIAARNRFCASILEAFAEWLPDTVPADGEWFNLEVDPIDPMGVVTSVGYDAQGWKYRGPRPSGEKRTLRVKLVRLGNVRTLRGARRKVGKMGCWLVGVEAMMPFLVKNPRQDHRGEVVFGGSSWKHPFGIGVACLHIYPRYGWDIKFTGFAGTRLEFDDSTRWLVAAKNS